jgi:hypothetical protein
MIPRWQCGIEGRCEACNATSIGRSLRHDQELRDSDRLPSSQPADLRAEPSLPVERHQRSLSICDNRLDLHDREGPRIRMPSDDIHGAPFAELVECDLEGDFPASLAKLPHHLIDERGVRLVEQTVETLSTPPHAHVELRPNAWQTRSSRSRSECLISPRSTFETNARETPAGAATSDWRRPSCTRSARVDRPIRTGSIAWMVPGVDYFPIIRTRRNTEAAPFMEQAGPTGSDGRPDSGRGQCTALASVAPHSRARSTSPSRSGP